MSKVEKYHHREIESKLAKKMEEQTAVSIGD